MQRTQRIDRIACEKSTPNIARWVDDHEGWIEIGYDLHVLSILKHQKEYAYLLSSLYNGACSRAI